jgi:cardiolipin synthase
MNIPNVLTTIRFFLIPIFCIVYFSSITNHFIISIIIFLISGITDVLDGYIARKYDMITKWGTLLDPLADKLMLLAVLFCLSSTGIISIWIFVLILAKEGLMILGGILLLKKQTVVAARYYGKAATLFFYLSIGVMILDRKVGTIIMYAAMLLAFFAFYNYLRTYIRIKKS